MSKKKVINFDLSKIAEGGVQVKLNRALKQVADNILDLNTDPTKKRKVQINITLVPNEKRNASDVTVEVKTTLAPEIGVPTTMLLGRDANGEVNVNELKSGIKGQTYIDPDDGKVKTDTGEPVEEVEKEEKHKIIDLQKKEN
ncbi:replication terminator protein [Limosilactobacillus reuteri]|uniref:Replication terminator protein n=1 Tax=Limosilactobacillus reuteri TaxID=1598 RepID=A0A256STY8_LIMRT|nr:replication terminator protein [Limosilactobacillus reuteri]OYS70325.1 replication terminator protein [Limosilactobacillus reuteri]